MGVHAMWISAIHNYGNILNLANFNIARDTYSKLVDKLINVPSIDINSIADELAVLDNFYNDIILHMSEADKRVFEYVNTDSLRTELHNIINNEDIWILPDDMDRIKDGIIYIPNICSCVICPSKKDALKIKKVYKYKAKRDTSSTVTTTLILYFDEVLEKFVINNDFESYIMVTGKTLNYSCPQIYINTRLADKVTVGNSNAVVKEHLLNLCTGEPYLEAEVCISPLGYTFLSSNIKVRQELFYYNFAKCVNYTVKLKSAYFSGTCSVFDAVTIYNRTDKEIKISVPHPVNVRLIIDGPFIYDSNIDLQSVIYSKDDLRGLYIGHTFGHLKERLQMYVDNVGKDSKYYFGYDSNIVSLGFLEYICILKNNFGTTQLKLSNDFENGRQYIQQELFREIKFQDRNIGLFEALKELNGESLYVRRIIHSKEDAVALKASTIYKFIEPCLEVERQDGVVFNLTFMQLICLWLSDIDILNIYKSSDRKIYFLIEDNKVYGELELLVAYDFKSTIRTTILSHDELNYFIDKIGYAGFRGTDNENFEVNEIILPCFTRISQDYIHGNISDAVRHRTILRERVKSFYGSRALSNIVISSQSVGLSGGVVVSIVSVERKTPSQLKKIAIIMDAYKYKKSYELFTICKKGDAAKYYIDNETFYNLLESGNVICSEAEIRLIPNFVVWVQNETDKEIVENIKNYKSRITLMGISPGDNGYPEIDFCACSSVNNFGMALKNVTSTEFHIPSFVTSLEIKGPNTNISHFGIESMATEPVDVSNRYSSIVGAILSDTESGNGPIDVIHTSEFSYLSESNNQVTIDSAMPIRELYLPRCAEIILEVNPNRRKTEAGILHKVYVRPESKIVKIKGFDEVYVAKDVEIGNIIGANKVFLHGGSLPSQSIKECKELIIDGGLVYIDATAMKHISDTKIICINGGAYKVVHVDSSELRSIYAQYEELVNNADSEERKKGISAYSQLFIEAYTLYKHGMELTDKIRCIPIAINEDGTITFITDENKKINFTIVQIYNHLNNGKLILDYDTPNGTKFSFIETLKYSRYKTLVFYPGLNNDFCSDVVRVLITEYGNIDGGGYYRKNNIVFAYQEDEWRYGKIRDLPLTLMHCNSSYSPSLYFDCSNTHDVKVALVFSRYNNLDYYKVAGCRSYASYFNIDSLSAVDVKDLTFSYKIGKIYFPASYERGDNFKIKKRGKDKSCKVVIGDTSLYGRIGLSVPVANAKEIDIIPGIGENSIVYIQPEIKSSVIWRSDHLFASLGKLSIYTPTVIEPLALIAAYSTSKRQLYRSNNRNHWKELNILADTKLHISNLVFREVNIANDVTLIIDASNVADSISLAENYYQNVDSIKFMGDNSKLVVTGLDALLISILLRNSLNKLATLLVSHADNYDELSTNKIMLKTFDSFTGNSSLPERARDHLGVITEIKNTDLVKPSLVTDISIGGLLGILPEEEKVEEEEELPIDDINGEDFIAEEIEGKKDTRDLAEAIYNEVEHPDLKEANDIQKTKAAISDIRYQVENPEVFESIEQVDKDMLDMLLEIPDMIDFGSTSTEYSMLDGIDGVANNILQELKKNIERASAIPLEVVQQEDGRFKVTNLVTGSVKILLPDTVERLKRTRKYKVLYI